MKLWLDDLRKAPEGWEWVKTAEECIGLLGSVPVEEISLDHDLGENQKTGYDVLNWIEHRMAMSKYDPPKMYVHSMNPVGRQNMLRAIEAIERGRNANL